MFSFPFVAFVFVLPLVKIYNKGFSLVAKHTFRSEKNIYIETIEGHVLLNEQLYNNFSTPHSIGIVNDINVHLRMISQLLTSLYWTETWLKC